MLQNIISHMYRSWKMGVTVIGGIYHTYQHQENRQHRQLQPSIDETKCWKQSIFSLRCAHQMDGNIIQKCRPFLLSLVRVKLSDPLTDYSRASGILVDNQLGLIVTNNHVIQATDRIAIYLIDNQTLRYCDVFIGDQNQELIDKMFGRVVYTAPDHDLALIQLSPIRPNLLPVCEFNTDCQPGDPIAVMSSMNGQSIIVDGLIQTLDKRQNLILIKIKDIGGNTDVLVHTGFITGGYSGGPVINMSGQVVAVHKGSSRGSSYFAVAISAKTVMDFIEKGKQYLLTDSIEFMQTLAVKHRKLMKNRTLGLVLVNNEIVNITLTSYNIRQYLIVSDRILTYNDIEFTTPEVMSDYVQQYPINGNIVLIVHRLENNRILQGLVQPVTVEQFQC